MAIPHTQDHEIIVSGDDARGGVTGHNVRYVLAFGMTGVIAMFAAIAIYFGYDALQAKLSAAFTHSPSEQLRSFAPYAAIVLVGALATGLLLGIWNLVSGRSEDASQNFMRLRVVAQLAIICMIMAMFYVSQMA